MRTTLLLSILLFLPLAIADNITATIPVSVSVNCGMEQCVINAPGLTAFYPGTNSTQTYAFNVSYSYQNMTVQNVTVVQNVTNVTVLTQVVNVTQCEAKEVAVTTDQITAALTSSIVNVCQEACAPGQAQKDQCNNDIRTAQESERTCRADFAGLQARYDAQENISNTQYNALNQTCATQLSEERKDDMPWMIITVCFALALAVVLGTVIYRGRTSKGNAGQTAEPQLPTLPK